MSLAWYYTTDFCIYNISSIPTSFERASRKSQTPFYWATWSYIMAGDMGFTSMMSYIALNLFWSCLRSDFKHGLYFPLVTFSEILPFSVILSSWRIMTPLSNLQNARLLHMAPHPVHSRPSVSASRCLPSLSSSTWPPSCHLGPGLYWVALSCRKLS